MEDLLRAPHPLPHEEGTSFQVELVQPHMGDPGCLLVSGIRFWKIPALVLITHKSISCSPRPGGSGLWISCDLVLSLYTGSPISQGLGSESAWPPNSSLLGQGALTAFSALVRKCRCAHGWSQGAGAGAALRRSWGCLLSFPSLASWLIQKLL